MMTKKPSGKTVMHSKPASMFGGTTNPRMPAQQPPARFNTPRDHSCKVCPGSKR